MIYRIQSAVLGVLEMTKGLSTFMMVDQIYSKVYLLSILESR